MSPWEVFAYIVMRAYWRLPVILALAAFVQGWLLAGVLFLAMAAVMYGFGRRARPPRQGDRSDS